MKFKIHDFVYVKSSGLKKQICDLEIIDSQEIYYMTDKTSYHVNEIDFNQPINHGEFIDKICSDKDFINAVSKDYVSGIAARTYKFFLY